MRHVMEHEDVLRRAKQFVQSQDGLIAPLPVSEEELSPDVQHDQSVQAYPLEATEPQRVPFDYAHDTASSEFCFFEDGRQRTLQIGHIPTVYGANVVMIPVHYFVVAAVILERHERRLRVWEGVAKRQGVLVAKSLVPKQGALSEFMEAGLEVVDTEGGSGGSSDYYDMRRRALREAKTLRLDVEQNLITRWRKSRASAESYLVVDGTLMNMRDEANVDRCVGVSKSFGSRYFDVSTHNRILQLEEGQRSWTFRFHAPDDAADDLRVGVRERVSWYLRLRSRGNADPEFGLIRSEVSRRYADEAPQVADRLSRSLLSERLPTAYPAARWDKMLYPIRQCENYLSSVMPSIGTITSSMGA